MPAPTIMPAQSEALAKQPEKTLWYMSVEGPDDMHAVPDFWTGLAWAAELNAHIAAKAAKENWAADDNWPLTQATIRRWTWSAEEHARMLARELSERQEHAEKRAAALAAKPATPEALAQLAEIPPVGSEERGKWLDDARKRGVWRASEDAILTLMSEVRRMGQRDVLGAGPELPSPDRLILHIERGEAGLWYVTSPQDKGLLVAMPNLANALAGAPGALADLAKARGDVAEPHRCIACGQPLKDGDPYYEDVNEGPMHAACCGPEPESFVAPDGEPLKPGAPIPEPGVYQGGTATGGDR